MSDAGSWDLEDRLADFAIAAVRLAGEMPDESEVGHLSGQMMRSATSVGAHQREANRSRSEAEFISKLEVALQELEETRYWLELLARVDAGAVTEVRGLYREADELDAILTTIVLDRKEAGGDAGD